MENFNAILKEEEVNVNNYETFNEAKRAIFEFIESWYNSANALLNSLRNRTTTNTKKKSNKSPDTVIYRKGNYNYYQLAPRAVDLNGLSFTSIKPQQKNYMITTVGAINSTKVLKVVRDVKDPNHYLVVPTAGLTLVDWIRSKPTANENPHPYTKILASVVWDSRGRNIGGENTNE